MPTTTDEYSTAGSYTWVCPAGVSSVTVTCVGCGGRGGTTGGAPTGSRYKGGGGGGASARSTLAVHRGTAHALVVIAQGQTSKTTWGGTVVVADYGISPIAGTSKTGGAGGLAANCTGDIVTSGGAGANGDAAGWSGGGGAGAYGADPGVGGSQWLGGERVVESPYGYGGNGRTESGAGFVGSGPGCGGGGALRNSGTTQYNGGAGTPGYVSVAYETPVNVAMACVGCC